MAPGEAVVVNKIVAASYSVAQNTTLNRFQIIFKGADGSMVGEVHCPIGFAYTVFIE